MHDTELLRIHVSRLCRGLLWAFGAMMVLLVYWQVIRAQSLRADPQNPRPGARMKITRPGRILTADGQEALAPLRVGDEWSVQYPGHEVYCHLTGYNGKSGLQKPLQAALYALGEHEDPWRWALPTPPIGCDVVLTIHSKAQQAATGLMRNRCGAVVAIDPRTGAIRVMVSAPAYDPATVLRTAADFEAFRTHPDKLELNRCLLGQYAPGSVLKIFTAAAAIDSGAAQPQDEFHCAGEATISGATIRCRRTSGHGDITLSRALAESCNVAFAKLGQKIGAEAFRDYVRRFRLIEKPDLPLPARGGRIAPMTGDDKSVEVAEAAFGQGATLVSPMAIARLTATIARGGAVPQVGLVESIVTQHGESRRQFVARDLGQAISAPTARALAGMMVETVERGTARAAQIPGVKVAGKTGSAQNPAGLAHAWFAAFAPAQEPRVAIAVIVENGGSGGAVAAPIARQVMAILLEAG